ALLALLAVVTTIGIVQTMGLEFDLLPSSILLAGLVVAAVLSYPILIGLEPPERSDPEQAIKTFYACLCHHVPNARRMWLMLTHGARTTGAFVSFSGFRNYWKRNIAALRGGRASRLTPLVFRVGDFRIVERTSPDLVRAWYQVRVFIRGRRAR